MKVTLLPPVTEVYPTESVSPTIGLMLSAGIPSTSAVCMANEARVPPMSGDPSTRLTVPSALTLAVALAGPVPLNQNPAATPRPWLATLKGSGVVLVLLCGLDSLQEADARIPGTSNPAGAFFGAVQVAELQGVHTDLLAYLIG